MNIIHYFSSRQVIWFDFIFNPYNVYITQYYISRTEIIFLLPLIYKMLNQNGIARVIFFFLGGGGVFFAGFETFLLHEKDCTLLYSLRFSPTAIGGELSRDQKLSDHIHWK